MEDCRNCTQWETCPCGKSGHEKGTSIGYSIGQCTEFKEKRTDFSVKSMTGKDLIRWIQNNNAENFLIFKDTDIGKEPLEEYHVFIEEDDNKKYILI